VKQLTKAEGKMKKAHFIFILLLILFVCCPQIVVAGPPVVIGNAEVIPYKTWEAWGTFNYKHTKDAKIYSVPTIEIIYGLLPRLEVGIESAYAIEDEDGHKIRGIDFVAIQPKYLIKEEEKIYPAIAATLQLEVPTDSGKDSLEWDDRIWAPGLAMQKHFGKILCITQLKYYFDKDYDTEKYRFGVDVFYKLTDRLKLLSEVYTIKYIHSSKIDETNFRLGFKYNFLKNAKVYFAAGRSLRSVKENRPYFEGSGGVMFEF